MAWIAACLRSTGAAKSGKPWARFTAPWRMASRVISRITDSVKRAVRSLLKLLAGEFATMREAISGGLALLQWSRAVRGHGFFRRRFFGHGFYVHRWGLRRNRLLR